MKNVSPYQLCKTIVKCFDEYVNDVQHACGDLTLDVHLDGSVDGIMPNEELAALAAYYGVKEVTNIHSDGTEYNAIWIAYKE